MASSLSSLTPSSLALWRRALLASAALGAMTQTAPALAQTAHAPPGASVTIDEIVVTARRREENLQEVPIPITAVSEAALQRQDLKTAIDIERQTPGLSICCGRGFATSPYLRGVPGVVGYFAEVPAPLDGGGQYFDVRGVEVLKGPQGTLFGASTNGGAILFEPQTPQETFGGRVGLVAGSRNRATLEGVLNAPVTDSLAIRLSGQYHKADGYIEDTVSGVKLGGDDWYVARASVLWRPTDALSSTTIVDYYRNIGTPYPGVVRAIDPNGRYVRVAGAAAANAFLAQQLALGPYKLPGYSTPDARRDDRQLKVINRTEFDLNESLKLKNFAGYTEVTNFQYYERGGTPRPLLIIGVPPAARPDPTKQYSEELQLQGHTDRLSYTLGSFNIMADQPATQGFTSNLGSVSGAINRTLSRTNALYGEAEYDLSDLAPGLKAIGGYRYTWDYRKASQVRTNAAGTPLQSFTASERWSAASYRLGLQWQVAPRTQLYITSSKGYSSGGFNLTAPEAARRFDPESLNNHEAGVKSDWSLGGMPVRTNLSAYVGDYDNVQVSVTTRVDTAAGPLLTTVTQNAAKARIKGVEGEFVIRPFQGFELSGNGSLLDAEYTRYEGLDSTGAQLLDLSDTAFVYTPKQKYSLAANYTLPLEESMGRIALAADYTWQSEVYTGARRKPVPFYFTRPGFETLNMSVSWTDALGRPGLDAIFFVTNVTENTLSNGGLNVYDVLGVWALNSAEPRTFGLRLNYAFQ